MRTLATTKTLRTNILQKDANKNIPIAETDISSICCHLLHNIPQRSTTSNQNNKNPRLPLSHIFSHLRRFDASLLAATETSFAASKHGLNGFLSALKKGKRLDQQPIMYDRHTEEKHTD